MAVSVRIEDEAFGDRRYDVLANVLGLLDADCARGKMAAVWRQCTQQQTHILDVEIVRAVLGEKGPDALVKSQLGEVVEGGIRIKGTKGRIEWLARLRKNGAKGGRPKKTKCEPSGSGNPGSEKPGANPPAPAPAPAPAQEEEKNTRVLVSAEVAKRVLDYLGTKNGVRYRVSKAHVDLIAGQLKSGVTEDDLKAIVDRQDRKWPRGDAMREYLRPETLFGPRTIAKYLDPARTEAAKRMPVPRESEPMTMPDFEGDWAATP